MTDQPDTLLLTISGKDRPGVTSAMFRTLTHAGVEVLDIEQIVLRGNLVLGILVTAPKQWKDLRDAVPREGGEESRRHSRAVDAGEGDQQRLRGLVIVDGHGSRLDGAVTASARVPRVVSTTARRSPRRRPVALRWRARRVRLDGVPPRPR